VAQALDIHPFMLSRWRKEVREGCTAPDFLDTERDTRMIIHALASGEKTPVWGDTEIAPPCLKSPL
jgi:hypothetical protein